MIHLSFKWTLLLMVSIGCLISFIQPASAQIYTNVNYYITNKQSGNVLDVRGGSPNPKAPVWQYDLNHSPAQQFTFQGRVENEIRSFIIRPIVSNHYLTVKVDDGSVTLPPRGNGSVFPPTNSGRGGDNKRDKNTVLGPTLIQDKPIPRTQNDAPVNNLPTTFGATYKHQQWRLVPVPGEANTFFIESVAYQGRKVLQPYNTQSGVNVHVVPFTGSNQQKWIIRQSLPAPAMNLKVSNLIWSPSFISGRISGKLTWEHRSDNETGFKILIRREDDHAFREIATIGSNRTSYEIKMESKHGLNRQHCFKVLPYNAWGITSSKEDCARAVRKPNTPPPSKGYQKIAIYNCHSEQKRVRIWSYDYTGGNGQWVDHGTLGDQWNNNNCPQGNPKIIELEDGHVYQFKAIDCGDKPPKQTDGSCHKMTTSSITGDADGTEFITATIN